VGQLISFENLIAMAPEWRRSGRCVVLASGAFDLLHPGHVRLLEQARSLGDIVVVALENDPRIRAEAHSPSRSTSSQPAASRPINPAAERAEILAALAAVDYVLELGDLTIEDCVLKIRPDVFVQGGFQNQLHNPAAIEAIGCKILHIPLEPGFSTATLIRRIQQLPQ